jgi:hypothetical protein
MLVADSRLMGKEDIKEQPHNRENRGDLFSDQDQSGALSEYEFFLPEIDLSKEKPLKEISSGEKEKGDDLECEMIGFFVPD